MPNVPVIKAVKLIRILKKKGFVRNRIHGSHHIFVHPTDKLTVSVPFHQGRDLGRGITKAILQDAHISIDEFLKLL